MREFKLKQIQSKIFLVAVLVFLTLAACKSETVGENPKESGGGSTAKQAVAESDPKAALVSSMKSFQEEKSWVADVNNSNDVALQAAMKMQVKYSAPDDFQIETASGANKLQMISVGGQTFLQTNGKWQKAPPSVNVGQMINNWKEAFSDQKLQAFRNIEFAGKETVDGKELSIYTYEIDQQAAMPDEMKNQMTDEMKAKLAEVQSENKAKIWIDAEKNLPARMEMTMKMTKPQQVTQKMSVNYDYDREVKIEAPKLP